MRETKTGIWAGLTMVVVAVMVGLPALLGYVDPLMPRPVWVMLYLGYLVCVGLSASWSHRPVTARVLLAVAVVVSWAVLLTLPGMGLVPILLVITAAVSVGQVPLWGSALLIVANCAVLGAGSLLFGFPLLEGWLLLGFYLLIQAATVLSSATLMREMALRQQLAEAHVELRAATVLLSEAARTDERLRISRELHDAMGHQLTVLTLELEAARHRPGGRATEHIDRADRVARELLGQVRQTVGELRQTPSDLTEALHSMVIDVADLDVDIHVDETVRVDERQHTALVRGVQEILTNTLRHAQAHRLRIAVTSEVSPDGAETVLCAEDDGVGEPVVEPGHGLLGLRERFEALGGSVSVDGTGGTEGFRVTARVPAR